MYYLKRITETGQVPKMFKQDGYYNWWYGISTLAKSEELETICDKLHDFAEESKRQMLAHDGVTNDNFRMHNTSTDYFETAFDIDEKIADMMGLLTDAGITMEVDGEDDEFIAMTYYIIES